MKTSAGKALYQRKPIAPPIRAAAEDREVELEVGPAPDGGAERM